MEFAYFCNEIKGEPFKPWIESSFLSNFTPNAVLILQMGVCFVCVQLKLQITRNNFHFHVH